MDFNFATLITGRAQSNVAAAAAYIASGGRLPSDYRGCYNYTDRNRVGAAAASLAASIASYGYRVGTVEGKSDWEPETDVTPGNSARYLGDIQNIKSAFYGTTPLPDTMDRLGWEDANNIERLLVEVNGYVRLMERAFVRCGAFNSGQEVIFPT